MSPCTDIDLGDDVPEPDAEPQLELEDEIMADLNDYPEEVAPPRSKQPLSKKPKEGLITQDFEAGDEEEAVGADVGSPVIGLFDTDMEELPPEPVETKVEGT